MLNVKLDKEPKNLDLTLIVVYDTIAQVHNTLTYYGQDYSMDSIESFVKEHDYMEAEIIKIIEL